MKQNGITHVQTSPYHPSSNGLAKRALQTFKTTMKRKSGGSVDNKVARFLFKYRVIPHSTTGVPPAELIFGRQLRTALDLLQSSIGHNVRQHQTKQKGHDAHFKGHEFAEGDTVFVKCFSKVNTWLPGVIDRKQGPVSYRVVLDDDRVVRQHTDHIITQKCDVDQAANQNNEIVEVVPLPVSKPENEVLEFAINTSTEGTSTSLH